MGKDSPELTGFRMLQLAVLPFVNLLLTAAGLTFIGYAVRAASQTVESHSDDVTEAAAFAAIAIVLLLVATVERFESIKGLGIEAKTRLDQKIEEANDLTKRLDDLAELTTTLVVQANTGRWYDGVPPDAGSFDRMEQLEAVMKRTSLPRHMRESLREDWSNYLAYHLAMDLQDDAHRAGMVRGREVGKPEMYEKLYELAEESTRISKKSGARAAARALRTVQSVYGHPADETLRDETLAAQVHKLFEPWLRRLDTLGATGKIEQSEWKDYFEEKRKREEEEEEAE